MCLEIDLKNHAREQVNVHITIMVLHHAQMQILTPMLVMSIKERIDIDGY